MLYWFSHFFSWETVGLVCSLLWVYLHCEVQSGQFIPLHTSQVIPQLLSTVTSSISTSNQVALAAIHAHAITSPPSCFTDNVVHFRSWAVSLLLFLSIHSGTRSSWFHLSYIFCGLPLGFLVLLSESVHSFFLWLYQFAHLAIPKVFGFYLMLFCFRPVMTSLTCTNIS